MKIPLSLKSLYESKMTSYESLKNFFDNWIESVKNEKWHYESRIKKLESFALKFETGRFNENSIFDDFFGGMIVVTSHSEIKCVEEILKNKFHLVSKKPNSSSFSAYSPDHFVFDDLRLYLRINKDNFVSPIVDFLAELVFEIQVKTYLQHAWSLSVHDLVYKSDNISWAKHRVAYQVKAMLENIEVSISSAELLSKDELINKQDKKFKNLGKMVKLIDANWEEDNLPGDKKRLAENIYLLTSSLNINIQELKNLISESKCNELMSISPLQSIIQAIIWYRWEKIDSVEMFDCHFFVCQEVKEGLPLEKISALTEKKFFI